jgi:hypothetical protein
MDKKLFLSIVLLFLAGFIFAENRTGKVVHIETFSTMTVPYKIVYLDSNDDKIKDAFLIISFFGENITIDFVLPAYIKVGSSIVFNYDQRGVEHGLFYVDSGAIISIDGIARNRIFTP